LKKLERKTLFVLLRKIATGKGYLRFTLVVENWELFGSLGTLSFCIGQVTWKKKTYDFEESCQFCLRNFFDLVAFWLVRNFAT